jgi:hypothetical protein
MTIVDAATAAQIGQTRSDGALPAGDSIDQT